MELYHLRLGDEFAEVSMGLFLFERRKENANTLVLFAQ